MNRTAIVHITLTNTPRQTAAPKQATRLFCGPNLTLKVHLQKTRVSMGDVAQVEETVKRLSSQKGVVGVLIVNSEGVPIRSTMEHEASVQYGAMAAQLARQARGLVREAAPEDDLDFMRLRSKRREVMIAPCYDREQKLSLVVVQDTKVE